MPDQVGASQTIRFATFEVDLQAQELRKTGVRLKLTGQPFQVLAILLEQPGTVVMRDELQKRLWPDTFVDVDHNLNAAINKIREALEIRRKIRALSRPCRGAGIDSLAQSRLMDRLPQWRIPRTAAQPVRNQSRERGDSALWRPLARLCC